MFVFWSRTSSRISRSKGKAISCLISQPRNILNCAHMACSRRYFNSLIGSCWETFPMDPLGWELKRKKGLDPTFSFDCTLPPPDLGLHNTLWDFWYQVPIGTAARLLSTRHLMRGQRNGGCFVKQLQLSLFFFFFFPINLCMNKKLNRDEHKIQQTLSCLWFGSTEVGARSFFVAF